ncbi:methyl-accepting chemotaxis protein [Mariniblastus fucicola]|uniref:Methyl-accepting chemotaxis protein McpC n=2 Tax=Pirellulaceae TaxID=2691357 RepID=A0A5B9P6V6_9BACT|nr:methyl-accepting chemotaxis protein [Mariniblastus fucicola]QEG20660.1 Methyl-accepting chemotaxis protein McpC [Mariniblastus fucicola]
MRLTVIQIVNTIVSVIAGVLLASAFSQTSLVMTAVFAASGVLVFFGSSVFSWMTVQTSFDSVVRQARDPQRDHFEKTMIHEFNALGRKMGDLRRENATRERQHEIEIAEAVSVARAEIRKEYEAAPSIEAQFRAIQGFLAGMDGHSSVGPDGQPLTCLQQLKRVFRRFQSDVGSELGVILGCGLEISRTTEELVTGSESQSEAFEKTNTLAEQLADRVGSICGHAIRTQEACKATRTAAEMGLSQVATLADEVQEVKKQSSLRERKLQALGQHAREVESILQTIGNLSSRTDLLALNASIESVRAGEHGRGFALVAEEVRALSEQSAQAVSDITARLELIQLETAQSLTMTTGEQTQLGQVFDRVTRSLEVLENICKASTASNSGLNEITLNSDEQMKLTQDIVETLQRTAETARINRSRAQGANWKAKSFGDLSAKIESTFTRFGGEPVSNAHSVQ